MLGNPKRICAISLRCKLARTGLMSTEGDGLNPMLNPAGAVAGRPKCKYRITTKHDPSSPSIVRSTLQAELALDLIPQSKILANLPTCSCLHTYQKLSDRESTYKKHY